MIVRRGKRYVLRSKESGRTLGVHPTRAAAERQETAINMSKARAAGHKLPPPPDERAETMRKLRSGKAKFVLASFLFAASAHAATKSCAVGAPLAPSPATATGPTTDVINAKGAPALVMQASGTGTATVVMEMSCDGTNWAQVTNSSMSVPPSQVVSVLNPTCLYRANITACTTCSVTIVYACSGP